MKEGLNKILVGGHGVDAKRRNLKRRKIKKATLEKVGRDKFWRNSKFLIRNLFKR